ncbi:putative disease resistance RPP13-like protein 1 [Prosopis cineraria]|uniref:putative disease resistance RPP13-like protein 1 n=1 Tax=Prosopis cineraria TaxID=364024 RepID=UPI0024106018|nr:putative disease resistance RPP13-like protein 1 [Prosopis cineraria]
MAGALVGGAFLSAFLQVVFDRLASPDVQGFFKKRKLNETLLKKFESELLAIEAVVDDAEQKQIFNPKVKEWLDMVKDAVFDAEDVIDEIDYEVSKRKVEAELQTQTSLTGKVRNFFSSSDSSFDKEVESRMQNVLELLEHLASQKHLLKLIQRGSGAGLRSSITNRLPTTSLVDEAAMIGRGDDKKTIIEWLLSDMDNSRLSVISIVGMGGLGKSTLAQLVYNDRKVMDEFEVKVWVCVSEEFDVFRVTRTIYEAITMSKDNTTDLNMLQIKLMKLLTQKKFLLVLDDVCNEDNELWEALQLPLNHEALGSKILQTTRSEKVVSIMNSTKALPLKLLPEKDSWLLFSKYALRDRDILHPNSDLEKIGRKICKKCKGLPLALKAIGSLLYTEVSHEQWNDILKSEIWEEKSDNKILPSLRLSYRYLPSYLKRCFSYCSIFPKDYDFDKDHLIQLWMAENFLPCAHQSKDARVIGEQCFHDLLSRSFFQRSAGDEAHFVMHDLVNDLAKDEYGKFCHRLELDEASNLSKFTRHVSYLRDIYETPKRFEALYQANRLRTFLPLTMLDFNWARWMSTKVIHDLLSNFPCMRVLSLSDYSSNIVELPDSIGNMKHLRYLDLSETKLRILPNSVCQLYHLQTLKLWRCWDLKKLPMDLHKLISLRHLDFRETAVREMPKQLGKLKNLQVLSSFIVGKYEETNIKQLKELDLCGSISISELQNIVSPVDALAVNLKTKIYLEELRLEWSMDNEKSQNDKDVLEKLQPYQNLKRLSISSYGGDGFPDWFVDLSLSKIVSLELRNCKYCSSLPSLGLFPYLKSLSIVGFDSIVAIGPEFHGNSSYTTSLEILRFGDMEAWEEWKYENMSLSFPHIQELSLENCPKLKGHLPPQLPSLRTLVIVNCEKLVDSILLASSLHKLVLRHYGKEEMECVPSTLKVLELSGCFAEILSIEKIENAIANSCLEELNFGDCPRLKFPLRYCHNFVVEMEIRGRCDCLVSFPLDFFPNLQILRLRDCNNLEMISISERYHHSLARLDIEKCPKFVSFPKGGFLAPKLIVCLFEELENLKSLPEWMHTLFCSLKHLVLRRCPRVESLPEGDHLAIGDTNDESLPDVGLLPPSLNSLWFSNCPNLRTLEHKGLCHLSSLKHLHFIDCPKLQYLPKEGSSADLHFCRRTATSAMAGALVGGAFISAFLQVAFYRLASLNTLNLFKKRKFNEKLTCSHENIRM